MSMTNHRFEFAYPVSRILPYAESIKDGSGFPAFAVYWARARMVFNVSEKSMIGD
jgi:hypothetical protein